MSIAAASTVSCQKRLDRDDAKNIRAHYRPGTMPVLRGTEHQSIAASSFVTQQGQRPTQLWDGAKPFH
jgi:hypothetical protein